MNNHYILKKKVIAFFCKCLCCLCNDSKNGEDKSDGQNNEGNSRFSSEKAASIYRSRDHQEADKVNDSRNGARSDGERSSQFSEIVGGETNKRVSMRFPTDSQSGGSAHKSPSTSEQQESRIDSLDTVVSTNLSASNFSGTITASTLTRNPEDRKKVLDDIRKKLNFEDL